MKRQLLILFVTVATLVGCGKDGETGPQGIKGEQGDKGDQGIAGVDGTVIHSGNGEPSSSLGKAGDYYIDLSTGNLYGAKTTSWGEPMSLKGEKGSDGTDGTKILSGETTPSEDWGSLGDFYFWTQELAFYGPKSNNGWGSPVTLGSTNQLGVQTFLIRNVKINYSTITDYTGSVFNYGSQQVLLPNVNLKRGVFFVYTRYKDDFTQVSNVSHTNYDDFSWNALRSDRTFENLDFSQSYNGDDYRFKFYYYGLTKEALRIAIIGQADNIPSVSSFKNWLSNTSCDILIKYIPEASVTQVQKSGQDINKLLSVQIN